MSDHGKAPNQPVKEPATFWRKIRFFRWKTLPDGRGSETVRSTGYGPAGEAAAVACQPSGTYANAARQMPYTANAAMPNVHRRARHGRFQNSDRIITRASGVSALK